MKKIVARIALFLAVVGIVAVARPTLASYCEYYYPAPPYCMTWAPSPPAGWTGCTSPYTPAAGEVALFDAPNYSGHCIRRAANFDAASLGDFDSGSWHVQSIRTAAGWYLQLWDGQNYTGSTTILSGGNYAAPSWQISSLKARN